MSQQVTLFAQEAGAKLSSKFQPLVAAGVGNDLGEGIKGSYGIVGIKAGKFRIKYKGEETILLDPNTGSPVGYIDVVIVKANAFLNKQFFGGKYVEGASAPPVCYSLDGVKPSDAASQKQATSCALCPKNQFGSLIGDNGVKQKACRDTKKLAVVPLSDITNVALGGAMLFRVPPSSLKELSAMADALKGRGYPYNAVAVRISFDLQASHPKPVFKALRALTDDEAEQVIEMFASDSVQRVLADNDVVVEHPEVAEETVAPVQPAGMPRRAAPVSPMPTAQETAPVPQARPMLAGMPGVDPPVAGIQPVAVAMPEVVATPRVLRVQPDEAPANPFSGVKATVESEAPAAQAAAPLPSNPFSAPPAKKAAVRKAQPAPVTVEAEPVAPPEQPSQLNDDISNILAGLDM